MTPYYSDSWLTVYQGDCREVMAAMEPESVHCVVTSPPYWGLRDYGTATWLGGDEDCDHKGPSQAQGGPAARPKNGLLFKAFGHTCGKCGAVRQDSQLGLEPTPEEYVTNMVAVFREVRRVLRADGTVWLNLGDSYAGSGGFAPNAPTNQARAAGDPEAWGKLNPAKMDRMSAKRAAPHHGLNPTKPVPGNKPSGYTPTGLKPKDLVGIPWRVAFALQQPYYTGTIRDERDRIWLAAMLDAEGCLFLHKRKTGQSNGQGYVRKNDSYGAGMEIANTSEAIVKRCMEIAGGRGSISRQDKARRQPLYRWSMRSNECRDVVRELYPHLVAKQHQARLLLGCPSSGPDAEKAHTSLMALHNGSGTSIDFPAPASMYEPGWYVRSDIVWSKLNPMPESVTDRPTKAHEYLFLLSKSPRYYYDSDAVRENYAQGIEAAKPWAANGGVRNVGGRTDGLARGTAPEWEPSASGRNLRSVWSIATQPYPGAHFATFPEALVEPCVKAGTSERGVCPECGAPWVRETSKDPDNDGYPNGPGGSKTFRNPDRHETPENGSTLATVARYTVTTTGWRPSCTHKTGADSHDLGVSRPMAPAPVPATVLDPFAGSGTTGRVAQRLGRRAVLIDLSGEYLTQAMRRNQDIPLGLESA